MLFVELSGVKVLGKKSATRRKGMFLMAVSKQSLVYVSIMILTVSPHDGLP